MSKMTKTARTAFAAAGLLFALTVAASAAPPPAQPPKPAGATATPAPKILVINRSAILQGSKVGQDIVRQVQGFTQSAEAEFKAEGEGLRRDQQALQQQIAILAPDVKSKKIKDFQAKLTDFLTTRKADLLTKIRNEKAVSDAVAADLKAAVTEFKQTYR